MCNMDLLPVKSICVCTGVNNRLEDESVAHLNFIQETATRLYFTLICKWHVRDSYQRF